MYRIKSMAKTKAEIIEGSSNNSTSEADNTKKYYLTTREKHEEKAYKNMNVREKLHYLNVKEKHGHLTPDEVAEKEACEQKLGTGMDVTRDPNLAKERPKDYEEPKDIFKEGDILDYMYQEWLLDGANWLFKKTYKRTAITADYLAGKTWGLIREVKKGYYSANQSAQQDNTVCFVNGLDSCWSNYNNNILEQANPAKNKFKAKIERYGRGEGTDEEKNTLLYQILNQEHSPASRANACNHLITMSENYVDNFQLVHYMASTLTRAQMIQNAMQQKNPEQLKPELFTEKTKQNALFITKTLTEAQRNGQDVSKLMETMFNDIEKASDRVNKSLDKGRYQGKANNKGKDPLDNKSLQKVNTTLGLDAEGNPPPNIPLPKFNPYAQDLLAQTAENHSMEDILSREEEVLRNHTFVAENKEQDNIARRQAFRNRVAQMMLPNIPDHLKQQTNDNNNNNNHQSRSATPNTNTGNSR